MRCYNCKEWVPVSEHEIVKEKFDKINEESQDMLESANNYLNLTYCMGDEDLFDEDGFVVVCQSCLNEALDNIEKEVTK